jgi:hypothetical protein
MSKTLAFEDLEVAYEQLATAIDAVGPENESLFLAKLTLTLFHKMADLEQIENAISIARSDLENGTG